LNQQPSTSWRSASSDYATAYPAQQNTTNIKYLLLVSGSSLGPAISPVSGTDLEQSRLFHSALSTVATFQAESLNTYICIHTSETEFWFISAQFKE
jgi:hypothetical protein